MFTECTCQCAPLGHDHSVCAHTALTSAHAGRPNTTLPVCGPCAAARLHLPLPQARNGCAGPAGIPAPAVPMPALLVPAVPVPAHGPEPGEGTSGAPGRDIP